MRQENNDVVIKVTSEWEEYTARLNFDVDCTTMLRSFVNMMRSMTFTTKTIISCLDEVLDELKEEVKYNENNGQEDAEYGTTY